MKGVCKVIYIKSTSPALCTGPDSLYCGKFVIKLESYVDLDLTMAMTKLSTSDYTRGLSTFSRGAKRPKF